MPSHRTKKSANEMNGRKEKYKAVNVDIKKSTYQILLRWTTK